MTTIEDILNEGLSSQKINDIFNNVLNSITSNDKYKCNLKKLFNYALTTNPELLTNQPKSKVKNKTIEEETEEYITNWCNKYIEERDKPTSQKPLKTTGDKDLALEIKIKSFIQKNMSYHTKDIDNFFLGHILYMSAENNNGKILEEFINSVLENYGWIWCAGATYKAIDFIKLPPEDKNQKNAILLQVKNKYNTENSSSSKIRKGTPIILWNRLKRGSKQNNYQSIPNWDELINKISTPTSPDYKDLKNLLNEEKFLDFIEKETK